MSPDRLENEKRAENTQNRGLCDRGEALEVASQSVEHEPCPLGDNGRRARDGRRSRRSGTGIVAAGRNGFEQSAIARASADHAQRLGSALVETYRAALLVLTRFGNHPDVGFMPSWECYASRLPSAIFHVLR
jgi:hypothetical protein